MESVIEPSLISYDLNDNNDISTMSRIPKLSQLSSTYYISFYSGILRNSCEFLNWFFNCTFSFFEFTVDKFLVQ